LRITIQGNAVRVALSRASQAVEQFNVGTDGLLKISATPYLSEAALPPLIAAFQNKWQDVQIDQ